MLKITNVQTCNWDAAIRGMRNPLESWSKSDTRMECPDEGTERWCGEPIIGPNDLDLMKRLVNAGTDHSKFMRMITVSFDITAPLYWWKEFDTYKIGTVRNSCSTMHKIEARELTIDDFATDDLLKNDIEICLQPTIDYINELITMYKEIGLYHDSRASIHRRIVKLLPDSYMQKATITTNYQVLRAIRNSDRKTHKLLEWKEDFMKFIDSLPYAKELLIKDDLYKYELIDKEYKKIIESGDKRALAHFKMKHVYTMTKEEQNILNEDKVTVFFNEALNGIKAYAEKKDPCAGLTCYEEKEDGVYYRCTECTHTYNVEECYHYYECALKGTGVAIPEKDNVKGLVIKPGAFNGEEF